MENIIDKTKFIVQRYDNYISQANVKGNFLLAFNTFLIGGIVSNYSKIIKLVTDGLFITSINIILGLLIFGSLLTAFFVIRAVYPFILSNNSSTENYHSHIFFNSVAEFSNRVEYLESFSKLTEEQFNSDLVYQAYTLSKGLKKKYKFLEIAMKIIYVELVLIFILLILIFI